MQAKGLGKWSRVCFRVGPRRSRGRLGVTAALLLASFPWAAVSVASAREPIPALGRTALVIPVSGKVLITAKRGRAVALRKPGRLIAFGSTVDVSHGKVKLVTAGGRSGHRQWGVFDGGAFVVTQERSAITDLLLVRGRKAKICAARPRTRSGQAARLKSSVLRVLHATAHGRFRSIGRYAAGTVRGTRWTTIDRCAGTSIADHVGHVDTSTRGAPLAFSLAPRYSVEYRCASRGIAPVSAGYCVAVLSEDTITVVNGHRLRFVAFGIGLITKSSADHTDVCVSGPTRPTTCTPYPLAPPDRFGFRQSVVGCVPNQGPGDYVISWRVQGVPLGAPLTYHAPVRSSLTIPCRAWLGQPSVGRSLASFAADLRLVNRFSLPTKATSTDLRVYLAPSGSAGQQLIRGIVYADSGGAPAALLGVTNELAFQSSDQPGWYDLEFPSRLNLDPGNYWLGVITGARADVADYAFEDSSGSRDYNQNPYAAGPTNPFGPISTDSAEMSLYLVYDVAPSTQLP